MQRCNWEDMMCCIEDILVASERPLSLIGRNDADGAGCIPQQITKRIEWSSRRVFEIAPKTVMSSRYSGWGRFWIVIALMFRQEVRTGGGRIDDMLSVLMLACLLIKWLGCPIW